MTRWLVAVTALAAGCSTDRAPAAPPPLLRIETEAAGDDTRLTLIPASSIKINARVKPALELPDGTVLRFDGAELSADSAYFSRPPTALLPGRHREVSGTIRASVCESDAPVCRSLVLDL
jgi:hypothetical protein